MMNSDLLKREKIREALTARLLQLSKQCEEICVSGSLRNERGHTDARSETSCVRDYSTYENSDQINNASASSFDETKEMETALTDPVFPAMINNYVTPSSNPLEQDLSQPSNSNPPHQKAFYKTVVRDGYYVFENSSSVSVLSDIDLEVPSVMSVQSDSDSHLLLETPSTDLDHYINSSVNLLQSPNQSLSTLSDVSSETEADHVTVVSLTSDTDSNDFSKLSQESAELQSSHENISPVETQILTPLPKVLNELPVKNNTDEPDSSTLVPDSAATKTPRRRRLSYTLESPSPILERALKSCSVGPDNGTTIPKDLSESTVGSNHLLYKSESPQSLYNSDTCIKDTSTDKPVSARGYFSPRSRIPVINSIRPTVSSVLFGFDQQIQCLDNKNQSLRQYLDGMNSCSSSVQSPSNQQKKTVKTRLPNRSESLPAELKSLCEEMSLQRKLLTEQAQQLQALTHKQEEFFSQILAAQQQQMAQLQKELTRNVNELFAQQNLVVQTRLQNLEVIIRQMDKERLPIEIGRDHDAEFVDGKSTTIVPLRSEDEPFEDRPYIVQAVTDERTYSHPNVGPSDLSVNFDKVSAAVKGYLTRRLMKTEKVQALIQTIKDTMECALKLHEMANNNVMITKNDADLHQRLINQVTSACHAFHNVFFKYSIREKMDLIAQSRQLAKEKAFKATRHISKPCISSATIKSLERKNFLKSKSVSPNTGRRKWKGPKRPSTAMGTCEIRNVLHERKLSLTPVKERNQPSSFKGDCRSPSFYM